MSCAAVPGAGQVHHQQAGPAGKVGQLVDERGYPRDGVAEGARTDVREQQVAGTEPTKRWTSASRS